MTDITFERLARGIRAAQAAGNIEAVTKLSTAYRQMEEQQTIAANDLPVPGSPTLTQPPAAEGDYRQSYVGQGMSGVNEGLAKGIGLPADLLNDWVVGPALFGINSLAGTDFQPSAKPFGGSEMMLELLAPTIYEPSTDPGKQIARRIGQELGAMVPIGGPLAALSKTPFRAMLAEATSALSSGSAAATAQQIAPGNAAAEATASLVGGFTPAAVSATLRRMLGAYAGPSIEALLHTKTALQREADELGVRYGRQAMKGLSRTLAETTNGINSSGQPLAASVLEEIRKLGKKRATQPSLGSLDEVRQRVQRVANSTNEGEAHFGRLILDDIDDFIDSASSSAFKSRGPTPAGPTIEAHRIANQRLRKSELIADMIMKAKDRARKDGISLNRAMREGMETIIKDERKAPKFTVDERALMQRVAENGEVDKLLAVIAKASPMNNPLSAWFGTVPAAYDPQLATVPVAGLLANVASDVGIKLKTDKLQAAVQGGSPPVRPFALSEADKAAVTAVPIAVAANQDRSDGGLATWLSRSGFADLALQLAAGRLTPRTAYEAAQRLRNAN